METELPDDTNVIGREGKRKLTVKMNAKLTYFSTDIEYFFADIEKWHFYSDFLMQYRLPFTLPISADWLAVTDHQLSSTNAVGL